MQRVPLPAGYCSTAEVKSSMMGKHKATLFISILHQAPLQKKTSFFLNPTPKFLVLMNSSQTQPPDVNHAHTYLNSSLVQN